MGKRHNEERKAWALEDAAQWGCVGGRGVQGHKEPHFKQMHNVLRCVF